MEKKKDNFLFHIIVIVILAVCLISVSTVIVPNTGVTGVRKVATVKNVQVAYETDRVVLTWDLPDGWTAGNASSPNSFLVTKRGGVEGVTDPILMTEWSSFQGTGAYFSLGPGKLTDMRVLEGGTYEYLVYAVEGSRYSAPSPAVNITIPVNAEQLSVHFLSVGNGSTAIVHTPDNKNLIMNAGGTADEGVLTSYLDDLGITKVDALILSNLNRSYTSYVPALFDRLDILNLYLPERSSDRGREITNLAESAGCIVHEGCEFEAGDDLNISDEVSFRLLLIERQNLTISEPNIVVEICYQETSLIFTGDISLDAQMKMAQANIWYFYPDLITMPSQGFADYSLASFFGSNSYGIVVQSCSAGWTYGQDEFTKQCQENESLNAWLYPTCKYSPSLILMSFGGGLVSP